MRLDSTSQGQPQTPEDRSTTFRPVEGGPQMQSGEKLLVEAYAAIWILVFLYLITLFRRQRRLDRQIATLSAAIDKARQKDGDG
jgi:CcmD family protein